MAGSLSDFIHPLFTKAVTTILTMMWQNAGFIFY